MSGLSVAADAIYRTGGSGRGWSYHLIILNSIQRTVRTESYNRGSFREAVEAYEKWETKAARGETIEPVLVSAGPMDQLRRAYPNFFLDIGDFVRYVADIVNTSRLS